MDIRNIKSIDDLIIYFTEELNWNIDLDDFDEIDDITYDFDAADIGLKPDAFAKISTLRQLQPSCDEQKWGIFCVEFDSNKFEVSALRKILSGLIPKRRNAADHAVWKQKDLLFLCFWGLDNNRTIGIAHFEDKNTGLPQIKMISCAPAIEDFTQIRNFEERIGHLSWVKDESDTEAWYQQWSSAFVTTYHQVIRDSASLTVKLAAEAQAIRDRIMDIYAVENKEGYVHKLFADFKDNLIHDMTKQQFADMYAQTVVYGLFSARCMDKTQSDFNVKEAIKCIPNTNPFLKRLMEECLGESSERRLTFDELEVANVVEILTHTNTDLILKDFNRQTGGGREDPVIHFYEEFLTAYDKAQKVQRGVYYTPQPVVNFIVRAVDSILKAEFGLADGLASEETKTVKYMREKIRGQGMTEDTKEVPAVQILDPATGTGTFLRQTILQIYDNFRAKHKGESEEQIRKAWNEYVPKHLLTRLNGFELMMAPYAVAHMKLAMILKDTGYDFSGNHRLNVFLTNSLEEAGKDDFQMTLFDNDPLAFESIEANKAKKNNGINVIIGNPPYSGVSSNNNDYIANLINDYKYIDGVYFNERKHWLNDDYVKFIRYAQSLIEHTGSGILAYICPHGFLDNPTFRAMRWNLLQSFDKIYILNLHGNVNRGEKCPDGSKDENVFDIEQGVSIIVLISQANTNKECDLLYYDLYGLRENKYQVLNSNRLKDISWINVQYSTPYFLFKPSNISIIDDYENGFKLTELFLSYTAGVITARDDLSIALTYDELLRKICFFADSNNSDEIIRQTFWPNKKAGKYLPGDSRGWNLSKSRQKIKSYHHSDYIRRITYRPFDFRFIYYSSDVIDWGREKILASLTSPNIAIISARSNKSGRCDHFYITSELSEAKCGESTTQSTVFPLFTKNMYSQYRSNLNGNLAKEIADHINMKYNPDNFNVHSEKTDYIIPYDLLHYIYAIMNSNNYRTKYHDKIIMDFPLIPYPTNQETFWKLVEIGGKLRECHLMQMEFDTAPYSFIGDGTNEVVKPEYKNGKVYISKTQCFDDVPQAQWEQYIGGYQPLQKWLKDRKKTVLSAEDIEHYKKIIAALKLTEELMMEIDQIVEF